MNEENDIVKLAINSASREAEIFTEDFAGHSVKYRLLNTREDLQTAVMIKKWEGTEAYEEARATAVFSLSVISIDNVPFYQAISTDFNLACHDRWEKAINYYTHFIGLWYDAYMEHSAEMLEAYEELKKK